MTLIKPAHLVLCEGCKKHGHIVLSDGTKTEEIFCQTDAIEEVERLLASGKIVLEEADALADAFAQSPIPRAMLDLLEAAGFLRSYHQGEDSLLEMLEEIDEGIPEDRTIN